MYCATSTARAVISIRRAPSRASSSSVRAAGSCCVASLSALSLSSTFSMGGVSFSRPASRGIRVSSRGRIRRLPHVPDPQLLVIPLLSLLTGLVYAQAVNGSTLRHRSAPNRRTYPQRVCRAGRIPGRAGGSGGLTWRTPGVRAVARRQAAGGVPLGDGARRLNRVSEHVDPSHSIRYTGRTRECAQRASEGGELSEITTAILARQTQITQLQSDIETLQRAASIVGGKTKSGLAPVPWTGTDLGLKRSAAAVSSRS